VRWIMSYTKRVNLKGYIEMRTDKPTDTTEGDNAFVGGALLPSGKAVLVLPSADYAVIEVRNAWEILTLASTRAARDRSDNDPRVRF
jgi:hypothetical protein